MRLSGACSECAQAEGSCPETRSEEGIPAQLLCAETRPSLFAQGPHLNRTPGSMQSFKTHTAQPCPDEWEQIPQTGAWQIQNPRGLILTCCFKNYKLHL